MGWFLSVVFFRRIRRPKMSCKPDDIVLLPRRSGRCDLCHCHRKLFGRVFEQLGASVSLCAAAAMIPSFGCVLQFFSPFVFERMHHRKLAIWLMCVVFRLSVSSILLVPLALPDPGRARAVVLVLYTIGFFSAGLVTPGLEHMVWASPPKVGAVTF